MTSRLIDLNQKSKNCKISFQSLRAAVSWRSPNKAQERTIIRAIFKITKITNDFYAIKILN